MLRDPGSPGRRADTLLQLRASATAAQSERQRRRHNRHRQSASRSPTIGRVWDLKALVARPCGADRPKLLPVRGSQSGLDGPQKRYWENTGVWREKAGNSCPDDHQHRVDCRRQRDRSHRATPPEPVLPTGHLRTKARRLPKGATPFASLA